MTRRPLLAPRPRPPLVRAAAWLGRAIIGLLAACLLVALIAGVPYGLWHWLGWPLPHHWPTGTEIKGTLTGPFTDRILLDTLACLCWLVWAVFVADVARALPQALRDARPDDPHVSSRAPSAHGGRRSGPLRGLATVLLATIVASLVSPRPHPALATTRSAELLAPARSGIAAAAVILDRTGVAPSADVTAAPGPAAPGIAVVQPPHDGIHDSLWRIADRYLGNGARWPEIYQLNQGVPQADGGMLTSASLVLPGWILRLPRPAGTTPAGPAGPGDGSPSMPPTNAPPTRPPRPRSSPTTPPTRTGIATTNTPGTPTSEPPRSAPNPHTSGESSATRAATPTTAGTSLARHSHGSDGGLDLGEGVFVSMGFAAAISAAVVTERRRRRRRYVPGSGRRDDLLPVAPIVRSLHLAHLRATTPGTHRSLDDRDGRDSDASDSHTDTADEDAEKHPPVMTDAIPPAALALGRQNPDGVPTSVAQAVDLAVNGGLGLAGPGAEAALRGLLLELLARHPGLANSPLNAGAATPGILESGEGLAGCELLLPAATASLLLRRESVDASAQGVAGLHVVADLNEALDQLEAITLHRARLRLEQSEPDKDLSGSDSQPRGPVLLLGLTPTNTGRLQAVLDNGAALAVGGMMLGQWRPGSSVYVGPDGRISATSPGQARTLHHRRLPILTAAAAGDLLAALAPGATRAADSGSVRSVDAAETVIVEPAVARARPGGTSNGYAHTTSADSQADSTASDGSHLLASPDAGGPPAEPVGVDSARPRHEVATEHVDSPRMALRVLGPVQLTLPTTHTDAGADLISQDKGIVSLGPRQRELLVLLALHPDGIARDRLADTLWPDTPPGRPFNALHTTLNRLRRSLSAASGGALSEITRVDGDRYQLDERLVVTDFARLRTALAGRRAASDDDARARACRAVLAAYTDELAGGVTSDWVETPREALRREVLDAAVTLARHVADDDPHDALAVLETARDLDPFNEQLYRDIMRLQQRLGRGSSIGHTLALLTNRLAEIDQAPDPATTVLAERLTHLTPTVTPSTAARPEGVGAQRPVTG
ncbi:MAG TPA: BTAD domain-containing putative transcriptional regulator [Jatrophihabitans sp.]|nr:BTAD domain-containing putative transcriptional regulator [Jatrophihabitans sp.]